MNKTRLPVLLCLLAFCLAGCGDQANLPETAGEGPDPKLPPPKETPGLMGKTLAVGLGTSYAEPIVAQLLNEQTLIDLPSKGETSRGGGGAAVKIPAEFAPFSKSALQTAGKHGGPQNTVSAITTFISRPTKRRTSNSR
jgi:hypothetical protein